VCLSHEFHVDAIKAKEVRSATGLWQAKFEKMIDVQVFTLRDWEQGRCDSTGQTKALLQAIHNDPEHVLQALAD
jgi:putative transcriptional regulator